MTLPAWRLISLKHSFGAPDAALRSESKSAANLSRNGETAAPVSDMFISSRTRIRTRALSVSNTSVKDARSGECGGERDSSLRNAKVSKET